MLGYRTEKYKNNDQPVNEIYSEILGTPVNNKWSALVYAKIEQLEKIHKGGFYSKNGLYKISLETEDGDRQFFVKKEIIIQNPNSFTSWLCKLVDPYNNFNQEVRCVAQTTIENYYSVKNAGLPTFDEVFICKSRYVISTLATPPSGIVLALNYKHNLPLKDGQGNKIKPGEYYGRLKIKNFESLTKDMFEKILKANSKKGVILKDDCFFFILDDVQQLQDTEGVVLKWLVGDFDNVGISQKDQILPSLYIKQELKKFIRQYVHKFYRQKYFDIVDKVRESINKSKEQ